MNDLGPVCLTLHGALFLGAVAAWYKYGDRTDLTDKSLKGTKEALDGLEAYLGRALAEKVRPTVERLVTGDRSAETILKELNGEDFQSDISEFVVSDMEEMLSYRRLQEARIRWSIWARRVSWAIWFWIILQGFLAGLFLLLSKVFNHPISVALFVGGLVVSLAAPVFCIIAVGLMLFHHDQISKYRDKIL